MPEIGDTLREARMRARIDVSEVEAQTKIRAKYLRALENEEWGLLPGPTFVKSFLRTYAQALGVDGKALVDEYRAHHEDPAEAIPEPIVASQRRDPGSRRALPHPSRGYMALVGGISLLIVLLIVALLSGGGSTKRPSARAASATRRHVAHAGAHARAAAGTGHGSTNVSVAVRATGTVYVCLVGEGGRKLVPGSTLQAGETTATFRGRRFELTLGNNAAIVLIDGVARKVPASSQAIGYTITDAGRRTPTAEQMPTCA
jgi:Helix-turn-helix domain